jgi:hypothetical protein
MVVEIDYGPGQELKLVGNPINMSEIEQEVFKNPPSLASGRDIIKYPALFTRSHSGVETAENHLDFNFLLQYRLLRQVGLGIWGFSI